MSDEETIDLLAQDVISIARALVTRLYEEERAARPMPEPLEKLMSAKEVAALFERDEQYVYRLRREGYLKPVWLTDTTFAFDPAEVRCFIKEGGIAKK